MYAVGWRRAGIGALPREDLLAADDVENVTRDAGEDFRKDVTGAGY
jgi:hypothetical protein